MMASTTATTTVVGQASATTVSTASARYQRLLCVLQTALKKSRSQFDIDNAVSECYGDGDNDVFCTMLRGILDQVHVQVMADMTTYLKQRNVHDMLLKLECILAKIDRDASMEREKEALDKDSAAAVLEGAKLPDNIEASDMVQYQTYRKLVQERDTAAAQVQTLQEEIQALETLKQERSNITNMGLDKLQSVGKQLEDSADLCSTVS
jgi:hypothetical protein